MPPGHAKKWDVGQPLPREVRYYEVPAPLVVQLGQPAPGYRYVRVDDNILLLATGTRLVVDAIRGLGRS
jgi:Ni/Co efflux regulator RcnB